MFNPFTLEKKTIIITGASSGIGRQCAIDCSRMGAKVVLIARNEKRLKETLSKMEGEGHTLITQDLCESDKIPTLVSKVVEKCGCISGLVNCAGISITLPLKLMDEGTMLKFFSTNVTSAFLLTKEVCKLKNFSKEGGSIIFFSSVMGCVGETAKSLYSMTKGALISGVRSLACEYAKKKIRMNCVSPGAILTPINAELPHMKDPEQRAKLDSKHLLGLGKTTDISNACIYLLSDASRWVTGQNLIVDGGYTCR